MSKTEKLLKALDRSIAADGRRRSTGQEIVEEAAESEAMAKATRDIVSSWPDGSVLPPNQLGRLITTWQIRATQSEQASAAVEKAAVVQPSTATASLVTTMTPKFISSWSGPKAQKASEELLSILNRPSLFDEVVESLKRIGLNNARPGLRSSLECLQTAHTSLKRPGAAVPDPSAVLIGARESIDRALEDLVQRVPRQKKVRSATAKVVLIGEQLGAAGFPSSQFEVLGETVTALRRDLSSMGKQERADAFQISRLFDASLYFLKALAEAIDPTKLH